MELNSVNLLLREEEEDKIGLLDLSSKKYRELVKFEFQITDNLRAEKIIKPSCLKYQLNQTFI